MQASPRKKANIYAMAPAAAGNHHWHIHIVVVVVVVASLGCREDSLLYYSSPKSNMQALGKSHY